MSELVLAQMLLVATNWFQVTERYPESMPKPFQVSQQHTRDNLTPSIHQNHCITRQLQYHVTIRFSALTIYLLTSVETFPGNKWLHNIIFQVLKHEI